MSQRMKIDPKSATQFSTKFVSIFPPNAKTVRKNPRGSESLLVSFLKSSRLVPSL